MGQKTPCSGRDDSVACCRVWRVVGKSSRQIFLTNRASLDSRGNGSSSVVKKPAGSAGPFGDRVANRARKIRMEQAGPVTTLHKKRDLRCAGIQAQNARVTAITNRETQHTCRIFSASTHSMSLNPTKE